MKPSKDGFAIRSTRPERPHWGWVSSLPSQARRMTCTAIRCQTAGRVANGLRSGQASSCSPKLPSTCPAGIARCPRTPRRFHTLRALLPLLSAFGAGPAALPPFSLRRLSRSARSARRGSGPQVRRGARAGRWRDRRSPTTRRHRPRHRREPGRQKSSAQLVLVEVARWAVRGRWRPAGVHDGRLRAGELVGVVEVVRAAHRDHQTHEVGAPRAACKTEHRHQGHDAGAPADEQGGRVAAPDEPAPDRAAHLELVARHDHVVEKRRTPRPPQAARL